jgi:hypothetical protein
MPILFPEFVNTVFDHETGNSLEYRHLVKRENYKETWTHSFANELGHLAQGVANHENGTNTMFFICNDQVPKGQTAAYGRIVCELRPQKAEVKRTRLTIGGNLIDYPGKVSPKTVGLTTAKLVFNSIVSTPNARFMGIDVKNF